MITNLEQAKLAADILNVKPMNENCLYNLLRNGASDTNTVNGIRFPMNILPTVTGINENSITIKTTIDFSDGIDHIKRYFVPFTAGGEVVDECYNGYCDIYSSYHLAFLESGRQGNVVYKGIFHLNDASYENVFINEYGRIVSVTEISDNSDDIFVTRQMPTVHGLNEKEAKYFTDVNLLRISQINT